MKKILLIEDDTQQQKINTQALQKHLPYAVRSVKNYQELQVLIENGPNEIFIALLNNEEDTDKTIKFLSSKAIPVIVYDDAFDLQRRELAFEDGALEYLLKKANEDLHYSIRLIDSVYKNDFIKAIVVDGMQSFKEEIVSILRDFGIQTFSSSNDAETIVLLNKHPDVKIVIIDDSIEGELQGISLVEKIRSQYSSEEIIILGISSHGNNSEYTIEFLKRGANDVLSKPFIKEQFILRVMQTLEMLSLVQEKNQLASVDFLTQLGNRRCLDTMVPDMIMHAKNKQSSLAVAMIDIDYFKKVNDTYGHTVGDEILKHISKILQESFRQNDLLVRNGGEEFCVILDHVDKEKSIVIFESLRQKIEETPYINESMSLKVTVSIGLFHGLKNTIDEMLHDADELLYIAKNNGRNRLEVTV